MKQSPRISLCMIVKDEEEHLGQCLDSVKSFVDEIVIIDTGSSDGTVEIARSHGARIYFFQWVNSFAAARNESLRHATGDWIIYLDGDELLNSMGDEACLRNAASIGGVDAYSVPIKSHKKSSRKGDFDITHNIRMFRKLPGIHFVNEVHERVEPFLRQAGAIIRRSSFLIEHLGYDVEAQEMRRKLERNLILSRKHLERQPRDAYALFYLGHTLLQLDQTEESRQAFERALLGRDLTSGLQALILNLLAYQSSREGRYDEALERARSSLSALPRQYTAGLLIGLVYYHQHRYDLALNYLTESFRFFTLPADKRQSQLSQEQSLMDRADLLKLIAICHSGQQQYNLAIPLFHEYLDDRPEDAESFRLLALCYLNSREFPAAVHHLNRAKELGLDDASLSIPLTYAHFELGNQDEAIRHFADAGDVHHEEKNQALKLLTLMATRAEYAAKYPQIFLLKKNLIQRVHAGKLKELASALASSECPELLLELCRWIRLREEEGKSLLASIVEDHFGGNRIQELIVFLEAMSTDYPDYPTILDALGTAHIKAGNLQKAIRVHLTLEQLCPENVEVTRRLAGLFLKAGDLGSARRWLAKTKK